MANNGKKLIDLLTALPYGCNSGVAPLLLPPQQAAFALNTTFRGGYATDRPPVQKLTLDFGGDMVLQDAVRKGFFQGAGAYRPDFGSSQAIAQINGRLFTFTENGPSWTVAEITVPGDPNNASTTQVWMWQAEKWMIISDGSGKFPIFYDGVTSRRSYGPSALMGTNILANPLQAPAVGATIILELSQPYLGPMNVPVYFNNQTYQTISALTQAAIDPPPAPVVTPSYQINVKNVNAVVGTTVTAGTKFIVQPAPVPQSAIIASATFAQSANAATTNETRTVFNVPVYQRFFIWWSIQPLAPTQYIFFGTTYILTSASCGSSDIYGVRTELQTTTNYHSGSFYGTPVTFHFQFSPVNYPIQRTIAVGVPYTIANGTIINLTLTAAQPIIDIQVGAAIVVRMKQTYNRNGVATITNYNVPCVVVTSENNGHDLTVRTTAAVVGVSQFNYASELINSDDYRMTATNPSDITSANVPFQGGTINIPTTPTCHVAFPNAVTTLPLVAGSGAGELPEQQVAVGFHYPTPQDSQTAVSAFSLIANQAIALAAYQAPNVEIAEVAEDFTVAAVGATIQVKITNAYTGPANKAVVLTSNGKAFTIVGEFVPPPYVPDPLIPEKYYVTLSNLTDTLNAPLVNNSIYSIPEIPACRMGVYGLGQTWFSFTDGLSFGQSDIVGSTSGSAVHNYRDAVLKTTDLVIMGGFRLPVSGEIITSMTFVATLDKALGQGPLQVGVASGMFSCKAPFSLIDFQGTSLTDAIANPILTKSLIGFGPVAQNSTILANSDTVFRSFEGVNSLILARRDFSDLGGNTPISREMARILEKDNLSLLSYSSAIVFDNRLRMTCAPNVSAQGVFHLGELVLNYDLLSTLRGKAQPVWDGLWTGLNILQYTQGIFGPVSRAFAFSFNITDRQIELYELLKTGTQHFDNGDTRIKWVIETPVIFGPAVKPLTEALRLIDGEIYFADVNGRVDVVVQYRPIFYPCWRPWTTFSICADMEPTNAQEQVRGPLGFGEPDPKDCDPINDRPFRDAEAFQLRLEFTGHARPWAIRLLGEPLPTPAFAKPAGCKPLCLDLPAPEDDL